MSSPDLRATLGGVTLDSPLIPASGILPMDPVLWMRLEGCDGVCTKGLTWRPRAGNPGVRLEETPGGLLNSIGLENQGVQAWMRETLPCLAGTGKRIVLNLACEDLDSLGRAVDALGGASDRIAVLELNLSCPNVDGGGAAWGEAPEGVRAALRIARPGWKGTLWVKLTPQAGDFVATARAAEAGGADGVVVANTWLGAALDLQTGLPRFARSVAGLSGPAVFPLSLRLVFQTYGRVGIPIVGCGGVRSAEDALCMVLAGASAVEVGTWHFRKLDCLAGMCRDLQALLQARGVASLAELVGAAHRGGFAGARKERSRA